MIIFLYGEDTFRSLKKLKEIVAHYQTIHPVGLDLRFFDCQKENFEDFRNQFRTKSMFKEKKLFVLQSSFSNTQFKKKFLENKQNFLKTQNTILFYEKGDVLTKDPFFVFLKKNSKSQQFNLLKLEGLDRWIKTELKNHQTEIEPAAIRLLIECTGSNLWQLSNELNKLISYKRSATNPIILTEDAKALTSSKIELNIFKTIDFLAEKKRAKAIVLIHEHLKRGDSPLYLLAMINFQFRNLLVVKDIYESGKNISAKLKRLKLHPFVVRKTIMLSEKFSLEELKKIYQKLFEIDLDIKTGKINPELALDLLIAQI